MKKELELKTEQYHKDDELRKRDSDELEHAYELYQQLLITENKCRVGRGLILHKVKESGIWLAQDYVSAYQCFADPNGFNIRPRTANYLMKLADVWQNRLVKIGMKKEDINALDHSKLAMVIDKIMEEPDDDKVLGIISEVKTQTYREMRDKIEQDKYIVFDGWAKTHKFLNEASGYAIHLSQGKCKHYEESPSAQGWWQIFGNRIARVKIWIEREKTDE